MQKREIDHFIIVPKCWCTFRAKQEIANFIAYRELRKQIYLYCPPLTVQLYIGVGRDLNPDPDHWWREYPQ